VTKLSTRKKKLKEELEQLELRIKALDQTTKTIEELEENLSKVKVLLVAKNDEVDNLRKSLQSANLQRKELEEDLASLKKQTGGEI